jgi:hypothetical protein
MTNGDIVDRTPVAEGDPVLDALAQLQVVIVENTARNDTALLRIERIRQLRAAGRTYREIVLTEDAPLVIELATANVQALMEAGCRLRRTEACALHDEGFTMEQIAALFGVTRQRISEVLRDARAAR